MSERRPSSTSRPDKGQPPTTQRVVRLHKDEALELMQLANNDGLEAAKTHLGFLRPRLSAADVHEIAWRCEDPRGRGGIQTGSDIDGEYADIAITQG